MRQMATDPLGQRAARSVRVMCQTRAHSLSRRAGLVPRPVLCEIRGSIVKSMLSNCSEMLKLGTYWTT